MYENANSHYAAPRSFYCNIQTSMCFFIVTGEGSLFLDGTEDTCICYPTSEEGGLCKIAAHCRANLCSSKNDTTRRCTNNKCTCAKI